MLRHDVKIRQYVILVATGESVQVVDKGDDRVIVEDINGTRKGVFYGSIVEQEK